MLVRSRSRPSAPPHGGRPPWETGLCASPGADPGLLLPGAGARPHLRPLASVDAAVQVAHLGKLARAPAQGLIRGCCG